MIHILLNSIALDPNRWTADKRAYFQLDQLLDPVAKAGFRFIEVWQDHVSRAAESEIKKYGKIANSLGLRFPVIGMYPSLHLRGRGRQDELDRIKRLLNYAKLLESGLLKAFVGVQGSAQITDSEYQRSVEFMQETLELAASYNLAVTGETHPDTLFDSVDSCREFMKAVNLENFMVCFQPFDFYDTEKAIGDYRMLADDVVHIHYQGQKNGKMALLKDSDLDYGKLTAALVEGGFSGKICIEFVKDCVVQDPKDFNVKKVLENAVQDRDFVVNVLKEAGTVDFIY
ncbi:TIM barrel protein [candidate division KSB1 bacterium]|nr:TIM barrel protein [candidate division KSB1 bacterium]NIV70801.1 TIM barrel protein [Phycisphaerae bacterium]NIR72919.1 TIM barrel protein [candidate division KSB1 bacterium]NIT73717.1 TIM barrel protein [candidate division KSB1 bacterium]NIU27589.1 TIM barrel protein [candidate division KSB1 bacterium]